MVHPVLRIAQKSGLSCFLILTSMAISGCVYLPRIGLPDPSFVLEASDDGRIARYLGEDSRQRVRASVVADADAALTTRLDLINAAQSSLDLQYFIWQNDTSGLLVIDRILAAADRGVRVRALLDDVQLEGLVTRLTALDDHPNIEIRIFNPFSVRWRYRLGILRFIEFILDANRLNHRMHNKLLVADNQAAILGGRNIGDDYFGRSEERNFVDLDLLMSGPAVPTLSQGFDSYWNSRWSYPVNRLLNVSLLPDDLDQLRKRVKKRLDEDESLSNVLGDGSMDETFRKLRQGSEIEQWQVIVDDPDVGWFNRPDELADELTEIAFTAREEVLIVSPYLVPNARLLSLAEQLVDSGVHIEVITNSLETNDVIVAQATYSNLRRPILRTGIEVYELRGDANLPESSMAQHISLHPKYMLFDRTKVFLGSMNLDPRSLYLNTELGVYLESPELAEQLRSHFETLKHPDNAWRVQLEGSDTLWVSSKGTVRRTPAKSRWQRMWNAIFRLLPLSGQV